MPTIAPYNYIKTLDDFLAHWGLVNAALAPGVLTLSGGYALANLQSDRTALAGLIATVEGATSNAEIASADRNIKRDTIREKMRQFNASVKGLLPGSIYINALPSMPGTQASMGKFQKVQDDVLHIWNRINTDAPPPAGFTPPLVLSGYTRANFLTDATAMTAAYSAVETTQRLATDSRAKRLAAWKPIYGRLLAYRLAVQGRFPAGSPLIESLPALSPKPGSTPDAVQLNGSWDSVAKVANFSITRSNSPRFFRYVYRYSAGARYSEATAQFMGDQKEISILTFQTTVGLIAIGDKVAVKCFVETADGNEAGSNTVVITRS